MQLYHKGHSIPPQGHLIYYVHNGFIHNGKKWRAQHKSCPEGKSGWTGADGNGNSRDQVGMKGDSVRKDN